MSKIKPQNIVLLLVGLVIMLLGLNVGLGGIRTLGWQGPQDFIAVVQPKPFAIQDSHIRFIGGMWFGVGLIFALGAFRLAELRMTLIILCGAVTLAGFFRFSALDADTLLNTAIIPSLVLELVGFPLLALWLKRSFLPQPRLA